MNFLENLRNKSESYRRGVSAATALVVTLLIFGVWVTVIFPGILPQRGEVMANNSKNSQTQTLTQTQTQTQGQRQVAQVAEAGIVQKFQVNLAQTISTVKIQWASISQYFKEVQYESENQIQIVPQAAETSASGPRSGADSSPTNRDSSVVY